MSALRGHQPARLGPAPRRGRRPREVPGRGLQPTGPGLTAMSSTSHPSQPGCLVLLLLIMVDGPITY